ncbi:MAG: ATP-binding protein [Candidatus Freyarchaeota archaeon]
MLESLLAPAESDVFTGRSDEVRFFQRFISDVKVGVEEKRALVVSGIPGIGKSSLLKRFRRIAEVEGVTVIPLKIPLTETRFFFEHVKRRLDSLAPGARKRLVGEKPFAPPPPIPKEVDKPFEDAFIERFMEDMDKVKEAVSKPVFLFCDSFERFAWLGYSSAFILLRRVLAALSNARFPAFFVLAVDEEFLGEVLGGEAELFHVVELDPLPMADMRVLIQKLSGKLGFTVEEKAVEDLVKASGGIPYKLCLLLYASLKLSGGSEVTYDSVKKAGELLQENPLENVFGVMGDEAVIVDKIISEEYNLASLEALRRSLGELLDEAVSSLKSKGLVNVEDSFISLVSDALFHDLRLAVNVDQVYGKASILLKLIVEAVRRGTPVDESVLDWFRESATMLAARKVHPLVVELASRVEDAAKEAAGRSLFYDANTLFNFAADLYRRLGDYERAGLALDGAARLLAEAGKTHYARFMLSQASEFYERSGVEWRAKSSARAAARLFEDAGDMYFKGGALMLSRTFYRRAVEYLIKAGDIERALSLCDKALKAFRGIPILEKDFHFFKEQLREVGERGEVKA